MYLYPPTTKFWVIVMTMYVSLSVCPHLVRAIIGKPLAESGLDFTQLLSMTQYCVMTLSQCHTCIWKVNVTVHI